MVELAWYVNNMILASTTSAGFKMVLLRIIKDVWGIVQCNCKSADDGWSPLPLYCFVPIIIVDITQ